MPRTQKQKSATAYYRLAAKADRAGQSIQAAHYRRLAERLTDEDRRQREHLAARKAAREAWEASGKRWDVT